MTRLVSEDEGRPAQVTAGAVTLDGNLGVPEHAAGLVLFAHGSGSSRFSPRNRMVAAVLRAGGLATLLIDLLTAEEEVIDLKTRQFRFDIDLLAQRLVGATDWLRQDPATQNLAIGYFGSSTGAAAALIAATLRPDAVAAVVSRGGRPISRTSFCPGCKRRPCLSSAAMIMRSSISTDARSPCWVPKKISGSFPAQPICSRRRELWMRSPAWRPSGSAGIYQPHPLSTVRTCNFLFTSRHNQKYFASIFRCTFSNSMLMNMEVNFLMSSFHFS